LQKLTRAEYLRSVPDAAAVEGLPAAIKLAQPLDVEALPGFSQGHVSVQDPGAQYAAALLDLHPGQRVLDACAAPGGKCTHIYETQPALAVLTAVDRDDLRLQRLRDNCRRLGISMEVINADAADPESWWNGSLYDRILLDVPCSATGVIRRHPDIKVLRREADIGGYVDRQYRLLAATWAMLNETGRLLYATCSVLARENDQQIGKFLENHPDAGPLAITADWGITTRFGLQTLPGIGDADGFYYAVLEKHRQLMTQN
jgi:16S rRNA (cytosine967-C5)-methyltransferase